MKNQRCYCLTCEHRGQSGHLITEKQWEKCQSCHVFVSDNLTPSNWKPIDQIARNISIVHQVLQDKLPRGLFKNHHRSDFAIYRMVMHFDLSPDQVSELIGYSKQVVLTGLLHAMKKTGEYEIFTSHEL